MGQVCPEDLVIFIVHIMADTGWKSPGTAISDDSVGTIAWISPSNAKVGDGDCAIAVFGSMGMAHLETLKLVVDNSVSGDNKAEGEALYEGDYDYGGSTDTWSLSLSASDINGENFGVVVQGDEEAIGYGSSEYLSATNFGFSIPSGATINGVVVRLTAGELSSIENIWIDHIQVRVYYTEATVAQTTLVSPTDTSSGDPTAYFVWEIPNFTTGRNISFQLQIDKTDNTFGDIEVAKDSRTDSGFQYWDGADWQDFGAEGVADTYIGNQARIQVTLPAQGAKYWRVRGYS